MANLKTSDEADGTPALLTDQVRVARSGDNKRLTLGDVVGLVGAGSGTTNFLPIWTSANVLGNSPLSYVGGTVISPNLSVTGSAADDFAGISSIFITSPAGTANGVANIGIAGYGGATAGINLASAAGVQGTPVHTFGGDALGLIVFSGFYDPAWLSSVFIYAKAVGNWAVDNQASRLLIDTIDSVSQLQATRIEIDGLGDIQIPNNGLVVGTPPGGSQGAGTGNFENGIFVGGLATTGSGAVTASGGAATLNTQAGIITSEALVAQVAYTLTLTNSNIKSTSTVLANATNSANLPVTINMVMITDGQVVILVGMAALTGTVEIAFGVFN